MITIRLSRAEVDKYKRAGICFHVVIGNGRCAELWSSHEKPENVNACIEAAERAYPDFRVMLASSSEYQNPMDFLDAMWPPDGPDLD